MAYLNSDKTSTSKAYVDGHEAKYEATQEELDKVADITNEPDFAKHENMWAEVRKIRLARIKDGDVTPIGDAKDMKASTKANTVIFTCPKTVSELFAMMKNGKACLDDWKCVLLI